MSAAIFSIRPWYPTVGKAERRCVRCRCIETMISPVSKIWVLPRRYWSFRKTFTTCSRTDAITRCCKLPLPPPTTIAQSPILSFTWAPPCFCSSSAVCYCWSWFHFSSIFFSFPLSISLDCFQSAWYCLRKDPMVHDPGHCPAYVSLDRNLLRYIGMFRD